MARFTVHSWHQQISDATTTLPSPILSLQIAGPETDDWIVVSTALVDTGTDLQLATMPKLLNIMSRLTYPIPKIVLPSATAC